MLYFIRYDYFKETNDFASKDFLWAFPVSIDGLKQYTLSFCINEFHFEETRLTIKPNEVSYWRKDIYTCKTLYKAK